MLLIENNSNNHPNFNKHSNNPKNEDLAKLDLAKNIPDDFIESFKKQFKNENNINKNKIHTNELNKNNNISKGISEDFSKNHIEKEKNINKNFDVNNEIFNKKDIIRCSAFENKKKKKNDICNDDTQKNNLNSKKSISKKAEKNQIIINHKKNIDYNYHIILEKNNETITGKYFYLIYRKSDLTRQQIFGLIYKNNNFSELRKLKISQKNGDYIVFIELEKEISTNKFLLQSSLNIRNSESFIIKSNYPEGEFISID